MGILFPSETVSRRWDGALQARLRRAPLEAFLRARSLVPAPSGVAQDSDNLARVTVCIVEAGLSLYLEDREVGLALHQRAIVGQVGCLVSYALAELISQPTAWRIAALVSSARLLSPWMGLNEAAVASAYSVRRFQKEVMKAASSRDGLIIEAACASVERDDVDSIAAASASIAARFRAADSSGWDLASEDLQELPAGF
jgi:hypothetical protein